MQLGTVSDIGVAYPGAVEHFSIEIDLLHIDIGLGPVLCRHLYAPAVEKPHLRSRYSRRTKVVNIAGRGRRVESEGIEDVPGGHLAAVIIAAQGARLIAIEIVGYIADPFLAFPRLADVIVQIGDPVTRLIAVPIASDAAPDIVCARNILRKLHGEQ